MTKLLKALAGLLFIVAVVNAGEQVYRVYRTFHPYFETRDSVWQDDELLSSTRKVLLEKRVERIGFRIKEGLAFEQKVADFYWVQHALAPILVESKPNNHEWVIMDYGPEARPFAAADLLCVEDLGKGLSLHRKVAAASSPSIPVPGPDLGRVWHEQEGEFKGTWTRRGLSDTFDAVWTGPDGSQIFDEVRYESADCGKIVLFRKGTNGRYRGTLSIDGARIENGMADWFSPTHSWSASIEKAP